MQGIRQGGEHRGGVLLAGPGEDRDLGLPPQSFGDQADLLGGLAGAVDRLGIAAASAPIKIEIGELAQRIGHDQRWISCRVKAPDWSPRGSTMTDRKPACSTAAVIELRNGSSAARR